MPEGPFRVVIAGGGIAACEAALALRDLAGEAVSIKMVAPNRHLIYRPLSVREPFAYAKAQQYALAAIALEADAQIVEDSLAWVEPERNTIHTDGGVELEYDALVIATGARQYDLYPKAHTVSDRNMDESLHGVIQDIELGYVRRIAFVMPPGPTWPLPLYELAFMTAERARAMYVDAEISIVTPEREPLEIFGAEASAKVLELIDERRIALETGARAHVPSSNHVTIDPGDRALTVDRVIALPELKGPSIRGLRSASEGFIPIEQSCRVRGHERIFAAGDATDYEIKQGGISAQQAEAAASEIAAIAGAGIEPRRFEPLIRGLLLTGREPLFFEARVVGGAGFRSRFSEQPLWSPPTKIAARYLAPLLDRLDNEPAGAL